jgi:hypothetical protein
LEKALSDDQIEELNRSFADLIKQGRIEKTPPFTAESDEPDLLSKSRIAFSYNGKNAGRLNMMVTTINQMGQASSA